MKFAPGQRMVERVAQALYGDYLDNAHPDDASYWRAKARAAIEAVREPDREMLNAGLRKFDVWGIGRAECEGIFVAMIAAALTPSLSGKEKTE